MTPFFDHVGNVAVQTRPVPSTRSEAGRAETGRAETGRAETGRAETGRAPRQTTDFQALRLRLPAAASAVPGARHRVRRSMVEWGWGDQADTVELLFCELLSNAVKHTPTRSRTDFWSRSRTDSQANSQTEETVEVSIRQGHGSLVVTVDDSGCEGVPAVADRRVGDLAENGRGLLLVEALASAWGCSRTQKGTRTWFTLDLIGPGPH
ncbi:ATP-binding protein [Streptomyces sp. PmtG]